LRVVVADHKLGFIGRFLGIADLLATLPFCVASGIDLRSIRSFRFLWLIRVFKVVRYSKAIQRFHRAFLIAKEELVLFLFVALMLLFLSAVGIYYCEHGAQSETFASVFHSLWWSVATLTTVGYGDVYPVTAGGNMFTICRVAGGSGRCVSACWACCISSVKGP
jgi:voltage-gated potassium channel